MEALMLSTLLSATVLLSRRFWGFDTYGNGEKEAGLGRWVSCSYRLDESLGQPKVS